MDEPRAKPMLTRQASVDGTLVQTSLVGGLWRISAKCALSKCLTPRIPSERTPRLVSCSACGKMVSPFLENLMHHRNCDRSFANRGSHALHVPRPHTPHGEYSRETAPHETR